MSLILLLLVPLVFFSGGGFYLDGLCGAVLGLMLLIGLVGNFAIQFHPQNKPAVRAQ